MKLFAYGSNLCEERLRRRVPSARYLARARLDGYALRFHKRSFCDASGKANVWRTGDPDDRVWGAVFTCDPAEKPLLDAAEGLGNGYGEERLEVRLDDGDVVDALAYVGEPAAIDDSLIPFEWYLRYVVTGAEERGLPPEYVDAIRAQPAVRDPDAARAARNTPVPA